MAATLESFPGVSGGGHHRNSEQPWGSQACVSSPRTPVLQHRSFLLLKPWKTFTLLKLKLSQLHRLFRQSVFMMEQKEKYI